MPSGGSVVGGFSVITKAGSRPQGVRHLMKGKERMKLTRKLAVVALAAVAALAVEAADALDDAALKELSSFALTPPSVHALPDVPARG